MGAEQANCFACVGIRTAEPYFVSKQNRRAGAQTFPSDDEEKVEGEIPLAPTNYLQSNLPRSTLCEMCHQYIHMYYYITTLPNNAIRDIIVTIH